MRDNIFIFEQKDWIQFYGYWDNTDKDDTCSNAEWEQRANDWEEVLSPSFIPSECGFTFELADSNIFGWVKS